MSCPAGFSLVQGFGAATCAPTCGDLYTGTSATCTSTVDAAVSYTVVAVPLSAPANDPAWVDASTKAKNAKAVADAKLGKGDKLKVAFSNLQAAENARGSAPDAYETARVSYYTLLKGDTWVNDERERIAATEASPIADNYKNQFLDITDRVKQQKSTMELITQVKDKLLSVQDDLQFSVNTFTKQINAVKNQINID